MISYWETKSNRKAEGVSDLILDDILKTINEDINVFELKSNFETIRYISEKEYTDCVYEYVEPDFHKADSTPEHSPRFIIFSAPGATGKTALAMNICYRKNGIYWDLPSSKVAQFSFEGAISNAVGYSEMSAFINSIVAGENFFVIDAFDEAEVGSGRTGIEFFLGDLSRVTEESEHTCAVLMARTESALFIKNYFANNNIPFAHYEIGFSSEENAKEYIKNKLRKLKIPSTVTVDACIDRQFAEIKRIFKEDDVKAFIGYAPVLDALAASYDDEHNTLNLLQSTEKGENNCSLMDKILTKLLNREREKFLKSLQVKVSTVHDDKILDKVYTMTEQLNRIFGKILLGDVAAFMDVPAEFPIEFKEEYLEAVNTQLPQHPFIQAKESNGDDAIYDFMGAAFRDYVLAYALADVDLTDFVNDYLSSHAKFCPSQMLVEFYDMFSHGTVRGKDISLMYNSFKSSAQLGDKILVNINGDESDCSAEFSLSRNDNIVQLIELEITDPENGIYLEQLSNCYVDVAGKVCIGPLEGEARISNSVISCDTIEWRSKNVSIEAYSPGECILNATSMCYATDTIPRFEPKTDDRKNLKVLIPSKVMAGYFRLLSYRSDDSLEGGEEGLVPFANLVRRIFSCLRSHSKDTPARKMDFIDNRIIGRSPAKERVLDFLLQEQILYTDAQDWLYKLDTSKISYFHVNRNDVCEGDYQSLTSLYNKFCAADTSATTG